jgi:hypothetical protein
MRRWLLAAIVLPIAAVSWYVAHLNSAAQAAIPEGIGPGQDCTVLQVPGALEDGVVQTEQSAPAYRTANATLTPLAAFSVAARVLSRHDYQAGRESEFSPTDLALGWGPMAQPGMAELLQVEQGNRWYRYHWSNEGPPLAPAEIAQHSANMHMVPANLAMARALAQVQAGEIVRVDGWLLRIDGDEGWGWTSSLTREDVGERSCELVLVCAVQRR